MIVAILLAGAAQVAGMVQSSPAEAEAPPILATPNWIRKPSGADVARVYPKAAADRNQSGRAAIECTVVARGKLSDCKVLFEEPAGAGFGDAALKLADRFQMSETAEGKPTEGGKVKIPLTFAFGPPPPPVQTPPVSLIRHDGSTGRVIVSCRVGGMTPKPELEACSAIKSTSDALNADALDYVRKLPLPPGAPWGLRVIVPVVFGGG